MRSANAARLLPAPLRRSPSLPHPPRAGNASNAVSARDSEGTTVSGWNIPPLVSCRGGPFMPRRGLDRLVPDWHPRPPPGHTRDVQIEIGARPRPSRTNVDHSRCTTFRDPVRSAVLERHVARLRACSRVCEPERVPWIVEVAAWSARVQSGCAPAFAVPSSLAFVVPSLLALRSTRSVTPRAPCQSSLCRVLHTLGFGLARGSPTRRRTPLRPLLRTREWVP